MSNAINALIARSSSGMDFGAAGTNSRLAMQRAAAEQQAIRQRDLALAQDQQQIDLMRQKYADTQVATAAQAQADAEEEAAWDAAWGAKDWGTMARIDPQTTKILWEREQSMQPGSAGGKIGNYNPGDYTPESFAEFVSGGAADPRVLRRYVTPAQDKVVVIGGVPTMVDPRSHERTPLSDLPSEVDAEAAIAGAKASATETGKSRAAAAADLPRVDANADDMLGVLEKLRSAPGLRYIVGAYALMGDKVVPGTTQADAYAIWEQVQGKAFLEAFNTLKGGGQITEKEGEKATAAITRLANRKQSLGGFMSAVRDLESVVRAGQARARRKAGQGGAPPAAPAQKKVIRTGTHGGRKVVQYDDGTVEYQ